MIHLIHCLILPSSQEFSSPQHPTMSYRGTQPPNRVLWSSFYYLFTSLVNNKHKLLRIGKLLLSCVKEMLQLWSSQWCCENAETLDFSQSLPSYSPLNRLVVSKDPLRGRKRPTRHYWDTSPHLVDFLLEQASKVDPPVSAHPLPLLSSSQLSHADAFYRLCCSPYQDIFDSGEIAMHVRTWL